MVLFGELTCESPRMPSPWSTRRLSSSPASNATSANESPLLSTSLPPPSRRRASRLSAEPCIASGGGGDAPAADDDSSDDDGDEQGFFSLDLDLDRVSSALAPSISAAPSMSRTAAAVGVNSVAPPPSTSPPAPSIPRAAAAAAAQLTPLAPELDRCGNLEYKLIVRPATRLRFQSLVTQCQWRIVQGGGVATYEVGVLDCGALVGLSRVDMRESLANLSSMAKQLDATLCIRRVIVLESSEEAVKEELKIRPDDTDLSAAVRRAKIKSRAARVRNSIVDDEAGGATSIRALDEEQARTLLGGAELDALPDAWTWDVCAPLAEPDVPQSTPDFEPLPVAVESDNEDVEDDDHEDQGFGFSLSLDDYAPPVCKPAAARPATLSASPARSSTPRTPPFTPSSRTPAASGDSSISSSSSSYASSSSACSTSSGAPPTIRLDSRDDKDSTAASLGAELGVLSFAPRAHADKASKAEAARLKAQQQSSNKMTARARAALERRERRLAQLRAAELAGAGWAPDLPSDEAQVEAQQAEAQEEASEDEESLSFLAQLGGAFDEDDADGSDEWVRASRSADATADAQKLEHRNEAKRRRREVRRALRQAELAEREEHERLASFVERVYARTPVDPIYSASLPAPRTDARPSEAVVAALHDAAQALRERQAAHTRALETQLGLQPDTRIIVEAQVLSKLARQSAYFANFANAPS